MILIVLLIANLLISISSIVFAAYLLHTVQSLKTQVLQQHNGNNPMIPITVDDSSGNGTQTTAKMPIGFRFPT